MLSRRLEKLDVYYNDDIVVHKPLVRLDVEFNDKPSWKDRGGSGAPRRDRGSFGAPRSDRGSFGAPRSDRGSSAAPRSDRGGPGAPRSDRGGDRGEKFGKPRFGKGNNASSSGKPERFFQGKKSEGGKPFAQPGKFSGAGTGKPVPAPKKSSEVKGLQ